jgi:hypothetical protein
MNPKILRGLGGKSEARYYSEYSKQSYSSSRMFSDSFLMDRSSKDLMKLSKTDRTNSWLSFNSPIRSRSLLISPSWRPEVDCSCATTGFCDSLSIRSRMLQPKLKLTTWLYSCLGLTGLRQRLALLFSIRQQILAFWDCRSSLYS